MKILILILIMILFMGQLAYPITQEEKIDYLNTLDFKIAEDVDRGFNGESNKNYETFVENLQQLQVNKTIGGVSVIRKKFSNEKLLIGHSIVAFGATTLENEPIDVIGNAGASIRFVKECANYFNKKYKTIYIWIGINDVISLRAAGVEGDKLVRTMNEAFDELMKKYNSLDAKVYLFTISHVTNNEEFINPVNREIDQINEYIKSKYDTLTVSISPDFDEVHFTNESFWSMYVNLIKTT